MILVNVVPVLFILPGCAKLVSYYFKSKNCLSCQKLAKKLKMPVHYPSTYESHVLHRVDECRDGVRGEVYRQWTEGLQGEVDAL